MLEVFDPVSLQPAARNVTADGETGERNWQPVNQDKREKRRRREEEAPALENQR